jgi:hypothetical protein
VDGECQNLEQAIDSIGLRSAVEELSALLRHPHRKCRSDQIRGGKNNIAVVSG